MGFSKGYILLVLGNTYPCRDWLKESGAEYHKIWGWYFPSQKELPERWPSGLQADRLKWEEVADPLTDTLVSETALQRAVQLHRAGAGASTHQGQIGERLTLNLQALKSVTGLGHYGPYAFNILEDAHGNQYVWSTSRSLERGQSYKIRGTVKEHALYQGIAQTHLTRCRIL